MIMLATVNVIINLAQILGGAPFAGTVTFEPTGGDVVPGAILVPKKVSVPVPAEGTATAALVPNTGTYHTRYAVEILDANGTRLAVGYAVIPATNCFLEDVITFAAGGVLSPTGSTAAAQAAAELSQGYASVAHTDMLAAGVSASAAAASQGAAAVSQTNAGISAGTASAAQGVASTAADTATAQAGLAASSAQSAASVAQQDLSGVTAAALHRSPNAVTALFVYDTSKDSDGGAWVERVSHTSWMQEALNGSWRGQCASEAACRAISGAATGDFFQLTTDGKFYKLNAGAGTTEVLRGNTAKFPKQAAIVAEATNVTIYDLTQPGRPMWMRFTQNSATAPSSSLWRSGRAASSAAALNGVMCFALQQASAGDGADGLVRISFVADTIARANQFNAVAAPSASGVIGSVSQRNSTALGGFTTSIGTLAGGNANAVAMTVLPNAPVDPVAQLPVPTIGVAVGTGNAGQVGTVLMHDGTAVNYSQTSQDGVSVSFTKRGEVAWGMSNGTGLFVVPLSASNVANVGVTAGSRIYGAAGTSLYVGAGIQRQSNQMRDGTIAVFGKNFETNKVGLVRENPASGASGLTATLTGTYNTGWMVGDIRRCLASDTSVGAVSGANVITNGTFAVDTSGWTQQIGTIAAVGGRLRASRSGGAAGRAVWPLTCIPGTAYRLTLDRYKGTLTRTEAYIGITATSVAGSVLSDIQTVDVVGQTLYFVATQTQHWLNLQCDATSGVDGDYGEFDNVVLAPAVADRSVKAKSASINGTLTMTAVAAAAQMVAYSGFTSTNYIQESANSTDLAYGTAAWTDATWFNAPATLPVTAFPVIGADVLAGNNGNFNSGSTGWTVTGNDATHIATFTGTALRYQADTTSPVLNVQTTPLVMTPGKFYKVTTVVSAYTSGSVKTGSFATPAGTDLTLATGLGTTVSYGRATIGQFNIQRNTTNVDLTIDSITIEEIGLSCMLDYSGPSGAYRRLGIDPDGKLVAEVFDGTTTRRVTSTVAVNDGTSHFGMVTYNAAGGLSLYLDPATGAANATATGSTLLTLTNASALLTLGNRFALDSAFPGSIALARTGVTVPFAEQVAWIYAQERALFQPGVQCCLPDTGSVVSLDYDDQEGKVAVATAANQCAFVGLARVSNTPVAAGSYTKVAHASGWKLLARSTTSPGVDVTVPSLNLREQLLRRAEEAARQARLTRRIDFDSITGQVDFVMPVGWEVQGLTVAGAEKREGATKDWTRKFDGFKETATFAVSPGNLTWVQGEIRRSA